MISLFHTNKISVSPKGQIKYKAPYGMYELDNTIKLNKKVKPFI